MGFDIAIYLSYCPLSVSPTVSHTLVVVVTAFVNAFAYLK
jgi:hypothetical protein